MTKVLQSYIIDAKYEGNTFRFLVQNVEKEDYDKVVQLLNDNTNKLNCVYTVSSSFPFNETPKFVKFINSLNPPYDYITLCKLNVNEQNQNCIDRFIQDNKILFSIHHSASR